MPCTSDVLRQGSYMVLQYRGVNCLQVAVAGELDLKDIKQRHKTGVQHVSGAPWRTHGTHKLDVLHVLPVQFLATIIEALQACAESGTE